jgi:beta-lactamase class D
MHATKHLRLFLVWLLAFPLLAGCNGRLSTSSPSPLASPTPPAWKDNLELESYFDGLPGAFVLYDLNDDHYSRYHPEKCAERLLPASTFKIMNALIGLETGVIPDEDYLIKWDGTQHQIASWNQDHSLKTAMQNSVVWYYQELARRVGREKMQGYIGAVGYGNGDISGPIDAFWLDGSLKISADEQVEFLKRLYQGDLPFSERSMKIVKEILVQETTDSYELSGKTGSGQVDGIYTGWYVGYVERDDNVYVFAANLAGSSPDIKGARIKEITLKILQDLQLLSSDCGCS